MSDGRIICDFDSPQGYLGFTVGDEHSYVTLTYPAGFPITGMAANAATADGTIVGGASGYVVTWSGPDLTPNVLGRINNQNTTALATSRNGKYLAGVTGADGDTEPFVYVNGAFTTIEVPGFSAVATGVNDDGTVIGYALDYANNLRRGFTWRNGVLSWLNPLDTFVYSDPTSINDNGLIIGNTSPYTTLWDQNLTPYVLDNLAQLDPYQWETAYVYSINDSNQIVGEGVSADNPSQYTPFILNPIVVPEPASAAILLPAILLFRRRAD
jgi:probable HAF family extracellular repeat protein